MKATKSLFLETLLYKNKIGCLGNSVDLNRVRILPKTQCLDGIVWRNFQCKMNLKKNALKSYHASSLSSFKTVCQLLPFSTVLKRRNLASFSGVLKVVSGQKLTSVKVVWKRCKKCRNNWILCWQNWWLSMDLTFNVQCVSFQKRPKLLWIKWHFIFCFAMLRWELSSRCTFELCEHYCGYFDITQILSFSRARHKLNTIYL